VEIKFELRAYEIGQPCASGDCVCAPLSKTSGDFLHVRARRVRALSGLERVMVKIVTFD
jgi:hypothetical protein